MDTQVIENLRHRQKFSCHLLKFVRIAPEKIEILQGGNKKFFRSIISFFRSFISFFGSFI